MPSAALRGCEDHAPILSVPPTEIVAVEHPMIVKNLDNALKTFGRGLPFKQMMDPACAEDILPLYLRPHDPACAALESHPASTTNVVLKITVPKRTGRKRKRGSQGPFLEEGTSKPPIRLDANAVFRSISDNPNKYRIEPLGVVNITHRYRGMADFHASTISNPFMTRIREQVLSENVDIFKTFKFNPDRGVRLNEVVIPPPSFSETNLSHPWGYQKGFNGKSTKAAQSRIKGIFSHDISLPIPTAPMNEPPERLKELVQQLRECFEVRPIWTKRAILNHLGNRRLQGDLKVALPYVSYQFHGGPWRDASIKHGVDPRTDPKCRIYQTLAFKIQRVNNPDTFRHGWVMSSFEDNAVGRRKWQTHVFDGKGFSMDGRIWQVCDVTDPLLSKVLATEEIRDVPDLKSPDGWFCNGTHAKARAIMRTKIRALQTGQTLVDADFENALNVPENIILSGDTKEVSITVPSVAVLEELGNQEWNRTKKKKNSRNTITFKMNTDHGAKRGKRLDVKGLQDAIVGDNMEFEMDQSLRPSIETGGDEIFLGDEMDSNSEGGGDYYDEDGYDDDDDVSLQFHDDSSLGYDSDNDGEEDDEESSEEVTY